MIASETDTLEGGTVADAQNNKQTVIAYYNMAFNERKPAEAAKNYGGPYYTQHNPQAPDGFEAFVGFVEGFAGQFPRHRRGGLLPLGGRQGRRALGRAAARARERGQRPSHVLSDPKRERRSSAPRPA
jgi:hypothetical protein